MAILKANNIAIANVKKYNNTAIANIKKILNTEHSGIPTVLSDGNTDLWFDFTDENTITKDGSNYVSQVNDISGNNRHLTQTDAARKPTWSTAGIYMGRNTDRMKCSAFTFVQPISYYVVVKWDEHTGSKYIFDGNSADSCIYYSNNAFDVLYAGSLLNYGNIAPTDLMVIRLVANGSNSVVRKNSETAVTGNAGTGNPGGFTIGSNYNNFSALAVIKEIIARKVVDNSTDSDAIYNYLKNKHGL